MCIKMIITMLCSITSHLSSTCVYIWLPFRRVEGLVSVYCVIHVLYVSRQGDCVPLATITINALMFCDC